MAPDVKGSSKEPLNREPDLKTLVSSFVTPVESKPYDRNHGAIPYLTDDTHTLAVDGAVKTPLTFRVKDLKQRFKQHTVIAAMQCAGNRRHTMRTEIKEVQGLDWGDAAVMNCIWTGVRLHDVLSAAEFDFESLVKWESDDEAAHVQFACYQTETQEDTWYGGSIPLRRAMNPDAEVLLAMEMNGEPLTHEHGFPLRVVVPGVAGARSVKWLDRITLSTVESSNFYQKHDYKVLPPEATDMESAEAYWHTTPPVMDMPINSIIASPSSGQSLSVANDGYVEVRGYALPQGDQGPVTRVEVSSDEGNSWTAAELDWGGQDAGQENNVSLKWSWVLWRAQVRVEAGKGKKLWSRATDAGGNVQPREGQWTLRGVCYNAYGEAKNLEIQRE